MTGYLDLSLQYKLHFSIIANSDTTLTLTEIENMIPFERDIFVEMIKNRNEELKKQHG